MKLPGFFIVTGTGIRIRKFQKYGFFESCRAISGLSIRTYNDQMSFGGKNSDRHLPEENRRADSETGDIYRFSHLQIKFHNQLGEIHTMPVNIHIYPQP